MKLQLHRVSLDAASDQRLTDAGFHHVVSVSPTGEYFVDVAHTHDIPPVTRLMPTVQPEEEGEEKGNAHPFKIRASPFSSDELAASDVSAFQKLALHKVELFTFKAADGESDLYGLLHFPSTFDPARKYPLLVSVYAGPPTNGARDTFAIPNAITELGFLLATLDSRSASGRGTPLLD